MKKSKTCQLTTRSHQRPPSPMLKATTPAAPKDHIPIHKSIISMNAYATFITSGRLHTILTAACSTSMVKGSLLIKIRVRKTAMGSDHSDSNLSMAFVWGRERELNRE